MNRGQASAVSDAQETQETQETHETVSNSGGFGSQGFGPSFAHCLSSVFCIAPLLAAIALAASLAFSCLTCCRHLSPAAVKDKLDDVAELQAERDRALAAR